ncbi:MAG: flagellar type III secretion system pore protein FliP [Gemmatimonadetes bacterium]|nr:flagellar type III secretion system pore protein FliP [Gemmatimonadota bacterium]
MRTVFLIFLTGALLLGGASVAAAQSALPLPTLSLGVEDTTEPTKIALTLQILALMTVLSLAPAILVLTTSFTRIAVVLSFLRTALGTQQLPPNQIIIGLALFLTFFVMKPTWTELNESALQPYLEGNIGADVAFERASGSLKGFMLANTREEDLGLFAELRESDATTPEELGLEVIVPSFVISELRTAFQMGFVLYVPFLVIDMVVASVLMSMGMLMLPPVLISLPFKVLLFVLVDGWHLVVRSLATSFAG